MHDQEHLLGNVRHIAGRYTQPAQEAPHVRRTRAEDLIELASADRRLYLFAPLTHPQDGTH